MQFEGFYNWLYSSKYDYNLNRLNNPVLLVDPPMVEKKFLHIQHIKDSFYALPPEKQVEVMSGAMAFAGK